MDFGIGIRVATIMVNYFSVVRKKMFYDPSRFPVEPIAIPSFSIVFI